MTELSSIMTIAALQLKDLGNCAYKAKDYEMAIEMYTEALEQLDVSTPSDREVKWTLWSNRSACWVHLRLWCRVLGDCHLVLSENPRHEKSLYRQALALSRKHQTLRALDVIHVCLYHYPNNIAARKLAKELKQVKETEERAATAGKAAKNAGAAEKAATAKKDQERLHNTIQLMSSQCSPKLLEEQMHTHELHIGPILEIEMTLSLLESIQVPVVLPHDLIHVILAFCVGAKRALVGTRRRVSGMHLVVLSSPRRHVWKNEMGKKEEHILVKCRTHFLMKVDHAVVKTLDKEQCFTYFSLLCCFGSSKQVRFFLKKLRGQVIRPTDHLGTYFALAIKYGNLPVVRVLLLCFGISHPIMRAIVYSSLVAMAAKYGHLRIIQELVSEYGANATCGDNYPIRIAAGKGHLPVVRYLVEACADVNPAAMENGALVNASISGHIHVLKYLLELSPAFGINPAENDCQALGNAIAEGQLEAAKILSPLLKPEDVAKLDASALHAAMLNGHVNTVKWIVQTKSLHHLLEDAGANQMGFAGAAQRGHLNMVSYLAEIQHNEQRDNRAHFEIDPSGLDNLVLNFAAEAGHVDIVAYLLALPPHFGIVLSATTVVNAIHEGHVALVRFFVRSCGVDLATEQNEGFCGAALRGKLDMLEYLMSLPPEWGIDPSAQDNAALGGACYRGHLSVVKYLLSLAPRFGIDAAANDNQAVLASADSGHLHLLQYLCDLPPHLGIDVTAQDNSVIMLAAEGGHLDILTYLVEKGFTGLDFTTSEHYALRKAGENGHVHVLEFLVNLPPEFSPMDLGAMGNIVLMGAIAHSQTQVVEYLLQLPAEHGISHIMGQIYLGTIF